MKIGRTAGVLASGILIGAVVSGGLAQASKKYEDRPFTAATTGTSTSTPSGADTFDTVSTGTLNGTHVGNSTYSIEAEQDYARMEGEQDHPEGNCAFVEDGEDGSGFQITAANGDTIVGNIDDDRSVTCAPDSQVTPLPLPGDEYLSTLYIEVTSGTGRFADATGWLFLRGTSTFTTVGTTGAEFTDDGLILGDIDY